MLILVVLSLGLLAYKLIDETPCHPITIITKGHRVSAGNSFYLGETVTFAAQTDNEKVTWDFGDHSEPHTGNSAEHKFEREGNYIVSAAVNEKCMESVTISITRMPDPTYNVDFDAQNPITGPDITRVGDPVKLVCGRIASSYEWTVMNNPSYPIQHSSIASYSFVTPGSVTVVLKLDNDPKKEYTKTVQVLSQLREPDKLPADNQARSSPQPNPYATAVQAKEKMNEPKEKAQEEDAAPKTKATIVPDQEFESMFRRVTQEKIELADFDQYLCNGAQTKVLINEENWETLGSFYAKIRGKKKYDIQSVQAVRDEQYCVKILKVKSKRRGFLGL